MTNEQKVLIMSYPRSGNTWLRYSLEHITKIQTYECGMKLCTPEGIKNPYKVQFGSGKPFIHKEHFPKDCDRFSPSKDKIILLLRNYKECIIRHGSLKQFDNTKFRKNQIEVYINNLKYYNKWNNKIVIYYEDLISNFEKCFSSVVNFLNLNKSDFKTFLDNYENHKKQGIICYCYGKRYSSTKGNNEIFHSTKANKNDLIECDNYISNKYPQIFESFLKRYKEGE